MPDNYLLPLFDQDEEGLLLDPLAGDLAGKRDLLACLHPRERASLELRAAKLQTSQRLPNQALRAQRREVRKTAKAAVRKADREALVAFVAEKRGGRGHGYSGP